MVPCFSSETWTLDGWVIRRRDLSAGDLLYLIGPSRWHELTEEDLSELGHSLPGSQTASEHGSHDDRSWEELSPVVHSPEGA